MSRKFKFYLIGFIPSICFVVFILGKKNAEFSYLPNDRVLSETLTKKFIYMERFSEKMNKLNLSESFLKDSIFRKGKIDFSRSKAQKKPCPLYLLEYPFRNPTYEIEYEKCEKQAVFLDIIDK